MTVHDGTTLLQAARELTPAIAARAAEIDAGRTLPPDLVAQLRAAGFFRMFVPRSHGGAEVDLRTGCDVLEALARVDGSLGWTVMIGAETPHLLALLPRARFDALYAGGPDVVLAGGFNAQGEAHAGPAGYRARGRWNFASGSRHADWLFGNCVVLRDGRPQDGPMPGVPATRAVLLRPDQARVLDTWHALGLRGTGSHDLAVEDADVPEDMSFDIFFGQACVGGPGFVAPLLHFLVHMAAVAVGISQGALDDAVAVALAGKRRLYARQELAQTPTFQLALGRAETEVRAARALLRDVADGFWTTCVADPAAALTHAPRLSAALAWISETTVRAVDVCYRAGGGGAARDASPLQRRFRDMHTFSQHAAAAEGWFGQAGALLLGQPTGFWT